MLSSRVKNKIAHGGTVLCAKASYTDPDIIELMGTFGFDAIWICLEHKRLDPSSIYSLLRACRLGGMDPLIRVKPANYTDLLWLLEAGARGIMLPKVTHVDEVRAVIDAMKFPPLGNRGLDGVQAESNFGRMVQSEYVARANDGNFLVVQIEDPAVAPHIDAIAALPGVDVLFVGPGDLTLSLGKLGQTDDPEVVAILNQVVTACKKHGKVAAIPCPPDQVRKYHDLGFRFFNVTSDYRCVLNSLFKTQADLTALGFPLNTGPQTNGSATGGLLPAFAAPTTPKRSY
ncbi:MAG: hypothetical protein RIQ93_826 [Verrucomicrobiota bacterium]|jgi:2-keto-3-deoxy-L-rhamnonate aldolase RhmA